MDEQVTREKGMIPSATPGDLTYLPSDAEREAGWVNATGDARWDNDPELDKHLQRVSRELADWVNRTQRRQSQPSIFNRAAYVAPDNPFAQMETAKSAVENDDIVGGVADVTEGLAFQGIKWESEEPDEADVFNQIARDINLDDFIRSFYREEYTFSQAVVGVWWGRKTYKVRGRTAADPPEGVDLDPVTGTPVDDTGAPIPRKKGAKRRKSYSLICPIALTLLDPRKVVPLTPGPFGQDRLTWHATEEEYAIISAGESAANIDPLLYQFTAGPVTSVSELDERWLASLGIDYHRLLWLNPKQVWRHTGTKAHYDRFPQFRLKGTFPLLDMKQQLMEADRVSLVGSANYILLVKQGSDAIPGKQEEIDNLKEGMKVLAKLPVIVGDHRLAIEIIQPAQDHVLTPEKYDTIDRRLINKVLGALSIGGSGQRNESTLTIARGIGRLLENKRHMMKRTLEEQIGRAVMEHPANVGVFKEDPSLTFTPRNVQLDNDIATINAILQLRTNNEISRESVLEYFGFDQAVEALRREFEEVYYDETFKTQVAFSTPAGGPDNGSTNPDGTPKTPGQTGRQGGRPLGGGTSPNSTQGRVRNRTGNGNPSTGDSA